MTSRSPFQLVSGLPESTERPVDLLVACHERIRRFSALAVRLATVANAPPSELAEASQAVHRYFHVALPLHIQDEDVTIRPILLRAAPNAVRDAVERMAQEHLAIDATLVDLIPRWAALAQHPEAGSARATELLEPSLSLQHAMSDHLTMEEDSIFPALASLGPEIDAQILGEMRARRAPPETTRGQ